MLQQIKDWLKGLFLRQPETVVDEIFAPVDPDKIAAELDVDLLARQYGERDLPRSDATDLDANEKNIINAFDSDVQHSAKKASDRLETYKRMLDKLDVANDAQDALSHKSRLEKESDALLVGCRDNLKPLIDKRTSLIAELAAFKERNGIDREPDYPESRFYHIAVLVLIFTIETVVNSAFFARGSEFGLVGGWIEAMQWAAVNLALAFATGLFLVRRIHHVVSGFKLIGLIGCAWLAIEIVGFNLFVGHFREIYAVNPEGATTLALQSFKDDPFALSTTDSVLLFVIGSLFAVVAAIDGYRFDDRYPGYGRLARKLESAKEDYMAEKENIKDVLANMCEEALTALDGIRRTVLDKQDELLDLTSLAAKIRNGFEAHKALLERTCNVVLARYRSINIGVRTSSPPGYFSEEYVFSELLRLELPVTISDPDIEKRKQHITKILASIDKQKEQIHSGNTSTLKELDQTIKGLEFGKRE